MFAGEITFFNYLTPYEYSNYMLQVVLLIEKDLCVVATETRRSRAAFEVMELTSKDTELFVAVRPILISHLCAIPIRQSCTWPDIPLASLPEANRCQEGDSRELWSFHRTAARELSILVGDM